MVRRHISPYSPGIGLVESLVVSMLLLFLASVIIFSLTRARQALVIQNSLTQAAEQAARELSFAYKLDQRVARNRELQNSRVFDNIRVENVVNDSSQFLNPTFNLEDSRPTVTVVVRYKGGQNGLPPCPESELSRTKSDSELKSSASFPI